jgi:hypothetical protein
MGGLLLPDWQLEYLTLAELLSGRWVVCCYLIDSLSISLLMSFFSGGWVGQLLPEGGGSCYLIDSLSISHLLSFFSGGWVGAAAT